MKVCRKCGAKYFGGEVFCSLDGEPLHGRSTSGLMDTVRQGSAEDGEDPFLGKRIEKYDIRCRIGEGGMGEVYEAKHVHIGKRVALKVLREDFSRKEDVVERFRQEARSASIIGHENIIDITDFGTTTDGRFFFVMEYLEGEDLATVFERQRTIPYERALLIIKQVCKGLMAAHEKGIVHRDLKPENIFLVSAGKKGELVKILDFGIAKMQVLDEEGKKLTKTGVVFGTPEYMSPEQAAGKEVDERIDIYALGVIMYEMFTGTVPFTGDTFMSILTKHMFEPVPEMRFLNPNLSIPVAMEQVVMRTLEKEPDQRIGSMAELLDAIRKVVADPETVEFAPASVPPRDPSMTTPGPVLEVVGDVDEMPGRHSRTWLVVALALVALLVVLGGGAAGMFYSGALDGLLGGEVPPGDTEASAAGQAPADEAAEQEGPAGPEEQAAPAVEETETVTVRVETDPSDTSVTVEGRGTVCEFTPCEVSAIKGESLALVLVRGKLRRAEELVADRDPTVVSYVMKPPKKVVKGKPKPGGGEPPGAGVSKGDGGSKPQVDVGELKIPSIYKKKE
jgi:serine/threonine-protein kinase